MDADVNGWSSVSIRFSIEMYWCLFFFFFHPSTDGWKTGNRVRMCERGWRLISHHLPNKHVEEQDTTGEKDPFPKVLQSGRWSCRRSLQGLMEVEGEILAFEEVEGLCSRLEGYANPKNELLFAPFWSCQKACELITSSAALLLCSQLLLWTTENFHLFVMERRRCSVFLF